MPKNLIAGSAACTPLRSKLMMFWVLTKSPTLSPEEKRALRPVGSTWLGPAQKSPSGTQVCGPVKIALQFLIFAATASMGPSESWSPAISRRRPE